MTTGEKIAVLRKRAGLSQEALGEKLGISRQAVSKWESDQAIPTMDNLMVLSKIFEVPVDTLLRPDGVLPDGAQKAEDSCESYEVPSAATEQAKGNRTKYLALAAGVLLCFNAACSVAALVWLSRLQTQVDTIPIRGGDTVYVPMDNVQENSDMVDYSVDYGVSRTDPERLRFKFRAMPKERDEGETAQFSVSCGEELVTADAVIEGGYYTGEAELALSGKPVSVSLMLTKDGKTRTLAVETLYSLYEEFGLDISWEFADDGGMGWITGKGGYAKGGLIVKIGFNGMGESSVWPVSGRVVLMVDGSEYDSIPIDDIPERISEWTDTGPDEIHISSSYYVTLSWTNIQVPSVSEIDLRVEIADNFGCVHTA